MSYLLDTGFLYASLNDVDQQHDATLNIIAIAERLSIKRILTLDQRDFRVIRPCHCEAFELLP